MKIMTLTVVINQNIAENNFMENFSMFLAVLPFVIMVVLVGFVCVFAYKKIIKRIIDIFEKRLK